MNDQIQTAEAKAPAPQFVIRLDRSRPFSECRGERTPEDPHYLVHYFQGRKVGAKIILLPFDAQGVLVPDDGKTEPYAGRTVDDKPVMHQPLYNAEQRALVDRMKKAASRPAPTPEELEAEAPITVPGENPDPADTVNFASWLRGEVRYTPQELRAAAKSRFHVQFVDIKELVVQAVLDEKIVPEDQVCPALAVYLPKVAA